ILLNLILFFIVSFILLSFGSKLLKLFPPKGLSTLDNFIYSCGIGFGVFGCLLYIIGLFRLFYPWVIWLLLILVGILVYKEILFWLLVLRDFFKKINLLFFKKNIWFTIIIILAIVWLVYVFIGTVSPVLAIDTIWYHFGEAKYYLDNHHVSIEAFWEGTKTSSYFFTSAFPRLAEMFFSLFLSFKAEIAAKLVNLFFGLLGTLAIFAYVRKKASNLPALISALSIFIAMPFLMNALNGLIDLIVFGFAAISFLAILTWFDEENTYYLVLAAIFSGFVISCKFNGFFIPPIFILIILVKNLVIKKDIHCLFKNLLTYIIIAFIFSFAWYLDNKLHTGSFIYPSNNLEIVSGPSGNILIKISRLFLENVLFIFPLLIFFIFGFSRKNYMIAILLFLSFLAFYLIWVKSPVNEPRYLLPGLVGLAILAGLGFNKLINYHLAVSFSAKIFVILVVLVNLIFTFSEVRSYFAYAFLESRYQFLTEIMALDYWDIYDYNGQIKKAIGNSKVLVAGNIVHMYYIDFPAEHASLSNINFKDIYSIKELAQYTSIDIPKEGRREIDSEIDKYFPRVYEDSKALILIYKI
ncbi:MAG: glycosyltransferase family 39 protein, partial [Candidatus Berkelbacteria bacterium]|nr:glycosyltransferase family 39 protein [Candidatus Berkelbacteria bacterium]